MLNVPPYACTNFDVDMHIHIYICMYARRMYVSVYVCMYARMCVCVGVCLYGYVYTYIYM